MSDTTETWIEQGLEWEIKSSNLNCEWLVTSWKNEETDYCYYDNKNPKCCTKENCPIKLNKER